MQRRYSKSSLQPVMESLCSLVIAASRLLYYLLLLLPLVETSAGEEVCTPQHSGTSVQVPFGYLQKLGLSAGCLPPLDLRFLSCK